MNKLKILLVEDDEDAISACKSTITIYKAQKKRDIDLVISTSLEDALNKIDNSFDGAIIDLKLDGLGDEGARVVEEIHRNYRIPLAIYTATPANADQNIDFVGVYTKGDTTYMQLLEIFFQIYDTGITRILGGRGSIEKAMGRIFWENLLPNLSAWKEYAKGGMDTETALLRFTVNHLMEILELETEACFPEEMYIFPPMNDIFKTGSIVKDKLSGNIYIILSPACDLAVHNGQMKTNRILVCHIENRDMDIVKKARERIKQEISEDDEDYVKEDKRNKKSSAERLLSQIPRNNYANYYHYLPATIYFNGGIIDFRQIVTLSPKDFRQKFDKPFIQISTAFTKDIVARFSSYYARQGQPDFDFDKLMRQLLE